MSQMNLSRFADPRRTAPVDLGECRCPGTPHERDSAQVRVEIGDSESTAAITDGGFHRGGAWSGTDSDTECIARFTRSWTLLGDDVVDGARQAVPISFETVDLLDKATRDALLDAVERAVRTSREAKLPNASGDPSPDSPPESGSRRPRARKS